MSVKPDPLDSVIKTKLWSKDFCLLQFNTYGVHSGPYLCDSLQFETIIPFSWNEVTEGNLLCCMTF